MPLWKDHSLLSKSNWRGSLDSLQYSSSVIPENPKTVPLSPNESCGVKGQNRGPAAGDKQSLCGCCTLDYNGINGLDIIGSLVILGLKADVMELLKH